jgi:uncharacterized phage protein (TIGR01671 family)
MREILFRAKRTDGKGWVKGCYTFSKKADRHLIWVQSDNDADWWHTIPVEVDPATVGQYTGLADKNGVKVFEGDVVARNLRNRNANYSAIGVVGFVDGRFDIIQCRGIGGRMNLHGDCVDVVGNIHDNPELLTPPPRTI